MGNKRGLSPLVENDPAVLTALNPLTGRGVWLPLKEIWLSPAYF